MLKSEKVAVTQLASLIHLQTTDQVEAIENEHEQGNSPKCCKCKSIQVKPDLLNLAKTTINHIALELIVAKNSIRQPGENNIVHHEM